MLEVITSKPDLPSQHTKNYQIPARYRDLQHKMPRELKGPPGKNFKLGRRTLKAHKAMCWVKGLFQHCFIISFQFYLFIFIM